MIDDELKLRRGILRILSETDRLLMPEPVLLDMARYEVMPAPSSYEFYSAMKFLEGHGYILSVRTPLGGPLRWKITDTGKATLLEG